MLKHCILILFISLCFSCTQKGSEREIAASDTLADVERQNSEASDSTYQVPDTVIEAVKDSTIKLLEPANDSIPEILTSKHTDINESLFGQTFPELEKVIQSHELPSVAAVGIKPYPNAYIIRLNPQIEYKGKRYVTMEMVSSDAPETVLGFYQKWKENWFYVEGSGVYTFKKDKDKYFRETNTLQILNYDKTLHPEVDSVITRFSPQSIIRVYYEVGHP